MVVRVSRAAWILAVVVAAVAAAFLVARPSTADAAVGSWPGHRNCPVDDPAMLASPPGDYTACVRFISGAHISRLKLGGLHLRGGSISSDFGVHGSNADETSVVPSTAPTSSQIWITGTEPLLRPLDPLCGFLPGYGPGPPYPPVDAAGLCYALSDRVGFNELLTVRIEPAGDPSGFRLSGVANGGPALTLPLKLRLISPALGPNCYIGSDSQPIVLRLSANGPASHHETSADPNGFAVNTDIHGFGAEFQDTSFAVPAARGCGNLLMNAILNLAFGLPSRSGKNSASVPRLVSIQSTTAGGSELSESLQAARDDPWWPFQ